MAVGERFRKLAKQISEVCGTWQVFMVNLLGVVIWLISGPFLHWSDTWQLWCNTATTVVTYLLVFLVMNTQSRDTIEMRLKLDEVILALHRADNKVIMLEEKSEAEILELQRDARRRADEGDQRVVQG